jgi:uncharacterized protein (DUF2147 family)
MRLPTLALILLAAPFLAQAQPQGAVGEWWMPENSGKIRIAPCDGQPDRLCGTITWLKPRPASAPPPKTRTGAPAPSPQSYIGKTVLVDMKPDGPGKWRDGRFVIPGADREIKATMQMAKDGSLRVNGCIAAVLCGGQNWRRVV